MEYQSYSAGVTEDTPDWLSGVEGGYSACMICLRCSSWIIVCEIRNGTREETSAAADTGWFQSVRLWLFLTSVAVHSGDLPLECRAGAAAARGGRGAGDVAAGSCLVGTTGIGFGIGAQIILSFSEQAVGFEIRLHEGYMMVPCCYMARFHGTVEYIISYHTWFTICTT
jgi:hypothetical protein